MDRFASRTTRVQLWHPGIEVYTALPVLACVLGVRFFYRLTGIFSNGAVVGFRRQHLESLLSRENSMCEKRGHILYYRSHTLSLDQLDLSNEDEYHIYQLENFANLGILRQGVHHQI